MTGTIFSKAWAIMILALVVFTSMFVGMDLADGDWQGAIINGILLAFWVFAAVWYHAMALRERNIDLEFEKSKNDFEKTMDDMLGSIKKDIDHRMKIEKAMAQAIDVIGADRPPKPSEFKKVEDRFHEITGDHYLKLSVEKGDKRPSAEVSDKPFPVVKKTPARKPAVKKGASNAKPVAKK